MSCLSEGRVGKVIAAYIELGNIRKNCGQRNVWQEVNVAQTKGKGTMGGSQPSSRTRQVEDMFSSSVSLDLDSSALTPAPPGTIRFNRGSRLVCINHSTTPERVVCPSHTTMRRGLCSHCRAFFPLYEAALPIDLLDVVSQDSVQCL